MIEQCHILIGIHKWVELIGELNSITMAVFDDADITLNRQKMRSLLSELSPACQIIALSSSPNKSWKKSLPAADSINTSSYGITPVNEHCFINCGGNKIPRVVEICSAIRSRVIIFCVSIQQLLSVKSF